MNDHIFVIPENGGKLLYMPREQADRLVAVGAAHWIAKRKIKLLPDPTDSHHEIPALPEFQQVRADTAHWTDWKKRTLRMNEEKQEVLHALKRLSA